MEKLQPVLKQIFWIAFSFASLFVLIGWWSAQADLSNQIETRRSAVAKAYSDAGQNVSNVPNPSWTAGAGEINASQEKDYQASARKLWETQLKARTYPREIENELNRLKFNSPIDKKALRERFAQVYPSYFNAQLAVIRPFQDGRGVVDISQAQITQENYLRWKSQRPTSAEIWRAQEDIWLLRSVFDAIAAVNKSYDRIDKAALRSLLLLQLRGGDRNAAPTGGGGGGFAGLGGGSSSGGFGYDGEGGESFGGGSESGVWSQYEGSLSSDLLTEEFGASAGGGGGGMYEDEGGSGGFGFTGAAAPQSEEDRYVDDDENLPYRTRAFALNVKILQDEIPTLLAELTNSSFPVEIVRVDAAFSDGSTSSRGGSGFGYGGESDGDYGEGSYDEGEGSGGSPFGGGGFGRGGFGGGRLGGAPNLRQRPRKPKRVTARERKVIAQGERLFQAALADPQLCTLRVAGLMTLYRSQEENDAEVESAAAAAQESQDSGGVEIDDSQTAIDVAPVDDTQPGDTETPGDDPAAPDTPADATTESPGDDEDSQPTDAGGASSAETTEQPTSAETTPSTTDPTNN